MRFNVKRGYRALVPARRGKSYQHRKGRYKGIVSRHRSRRYI